MLIEYCDKCGYKIEENDFQVGKVIRIDDRVICVKCAPPESQLEAATPEPRQITRRAYPGTSGRQASRPSFRINGPILFLCGALVLMAGAIYLVERSPHHEPSAPENAAAHQNEIGNPPDAQPVDAKENARFSMLLQSRSPEESKAEGEYEAILKIKEEARKLDKLTQFLANTPPDWDVSARARVTYFNLKAKTKPAEDRKPAELIGWFKLNEGKGNIAADSSPSKSDGKIMNSAQWVTAEKGGLHFKNDADHVVIPNSKMLDSLQENDYTLTAWFKPDSNPPEEQDHRHCGYSIIAKGGKHAGLHYYHGGFFSMDHWLASNERVNTVAEGTYPPNKFYHVAGVVNRTAGETRIYVNGKLAGIRTWPPNLMTREYGKVTWKIGISVPGQVEWSWPAKGIIRDVRLYRGILSEKELQALIEK